MLRVGIYGASGYTGQELLRILLKHSETEIVAITSRRYKGIPASEVYPVFTSLSDLVFMDATPEKVASLCDVVFLALPHGEAMNVAPAFLNVGKKVIDLSADFRLRKVEVYESWYIKHTAVDYIQRAVYGLPELYRNDIKDAELVANPGCYPTSVILGLAPLIKQKWIDNSSIIADSKSGVSGAGREVQLGSLFCEVNEGFKAYKIGEHRHTPEIEQELSLFAECDVRISFTPHLLPVSRGILSTIYATLTRKVSTEEVLNLYEEFYRDEKFVRVYKKSLPNILSVRGTNNCDIGLKVDERTGRVVIVSAIDNLTKGAAGQAIQNMNLMYGLPEDSGLSLIPVFP